MQKQASAARHEPSYVDLDVYREIEASLSLSGDSISEPDELAKITALLYEDARLLDQRKYKDWLALFTEQLIYWVPAGPDAMSVMQHCAVNFDDRRRLTDRVSLIDSGVLHAQLPPSRTARAVSNVQAWSVGNGNVRCHSVLQLVEFRKGVLTQYAGHQEHTLMQEEGKLKISRKVIVLLNGDEPIGNTNFIL